jgi:hypothetical protein
MQDVLAVDYHYGYHVTGTAWNVSNDNPGNDGSTGNLADSASWRLAYTNVKMVPIARLLVNTPFDTAVY